MVWSAEADQTAVGRGQHGWCKRSTARRRYSCRRARLLLRLYAMERDSPGQHAPLRPVRRAHPGPHRRHHPLDGRNHHRPELRQQASDCRGGQADTSPSLISSPSIWHKLRANRPACTGQPSTSVASMFEIGWKQGRPPSSRPKITMVRSRDIGIKRQPSELFMRHTSSWPSTGVATSASGTRQAKSPSRAPRSAPKIASVASATANWHRRLPRPLLGQRARLDPPQLDRATGRERLIQPGVAHGHARHVGGRVDPVSGDYRRTARAASWRAPDAIDQGRDGGRCGLFRAHDRNLCQNKTGLAPVKMAQNG